MQIKSESTFLLSKVRLRFRRKKEFNAPDVMCMSLKSTMRCNAPLFLALILRLRSGFSCTDDPRFMWSLYLQFKSR